MDKINKDLPRFALDVEDIEDGVFAISFVNEGAMEKQTVRLLKEKNTTKLAVDKKKRTIYGAIMVPDKVIYRSPVPGAPDGYEIVFSKEAIAKSQFNYAKNKLVDQVTLQHGEEKISDVVLFTSWIVADSAIDTSVALGLEELSIGSWVGGFRVDNDELLEELEAGNANEFSIEGIFTHKELELRNEFNEKEVEAQLAELLSQDKSDDEIIADIDAFLNKM